MQIRGRSGSYSVLMAFFLPVFFVLIATVINLGNLIDAKVHLQIALDRAMYAGAAKLAHMMNKTAGFAWEYHKRFRDLKRVFSTMSQESREEGESKLNEMEMAQGELLEEMKGIAANIYSEAHKTVYEVLSANIPTGGRWMGQVDYKICAGRPRGVEKAFLCDGVHIFQRDDLAFSLIEGESERLNYDYMLGEFADPNDKGRGGRDVVPYVIKGGMPVAIAGIASIDVGNPVLKSVFGDKVRIRAASAGQAWGGSIEHFGRLGGEDVEEVKLGEEGRIYLYHPSLVPFSEALVGR